MKFFKKPQFNFTSPIMSVDSESFFDIEELPGRGEFPVDLLKVTLTFNIDLNNSIKNVNDYDKVVVTLKSKEDIISAKATANAIKSLYGRNDPDDSLAARSIPNNTNTGASSMYSFGSNLASSNYLSIASRKKLSQSLMKKLTSGPTMLNLFQKKDDEANITSQSVDLSPYISEALGSRYNVTEIYAPTYKLPFRLLRSLDNSTRNFDTKSFFDLSAIPNKWHAPEVDPKSIVERINETLTDVTESVTDHAAKDLSSESFLESPSVKKMFTSSIGRSRFYYDMLHYFLESVPEKVEEGSTHYESRRVTKKLDRVNVDVPLFIETTYGSQSVIAQFDLYRKGKSQPEEKILQTINLSPAVKALHAIVTPPEVSVIRSHEHHHSVTITNKEKSNRVTGYNLYLKNIYKNGDVSEYKKVDQIDAYSNTVTTTIVTTSNLTVLRVVPIGDRGQESNVYTNKILGPSHDVIGNLTILVNNIDKDVEIHVHNIPRNSTDLKILRRDCTDSPDALFETVREVKTDISNSTYTIVDRNTKFGRTYEYLAVSHSLATNWLSRLVYPQNHYSNYVMYRVPLTPSRKDISVSLSQKEASTEDGLPSLSFEIKTTVMKSEIDKITDFIKESAPEFYDQFINPSNNNANAVGSPFGTSEVGLPDYTDLFVHQVIRTNMVTSEREVFDLISDGTFHDNASSRVKRSIKALNPNHIYTYQVTTYRKSPIELFKNFVARGIDTQGKEWFYHPYKWHQAIVEHEGVLYPDDKMGMPIIENFESLTGNSYGVTASYRFDAAKSFYQITNATAKRLDKRIIQVTWNAGSFGFLTYDSFVVMKVVNGVKHFVGRTKNNYIYHYINESDIGTVYYIISPVTASMQIDDPAYTKDLLIRPDGLTSKVKASSFGYALVRDTLKSNMRSAYANYLSLKK